MQHKCRYTYVLINNPTNATASTVIQLSGVGGGGFYTSCAGVTPITSVTYSTGTNTKTIYLKDNKAESLVLTVSDPSHVVATGTLNVAVTPAQVALTGPSTLKSGACSAAFSITTQGFDSTTGNVKTNTNFTVSGALGSSTFWADSGCTTTPIANPAAIPVLANQSLAQFYIKDNVSETLSLGISDPNSLISPSTTAIVIQVSAANIAFTGPATVVSGQPSTAFTITLKDAAGNSVSAPAATALNISGLGGTSATFYSNPGATSALVANSVTIPQGQASVQIFLKDTTAETVTVFVTDPAASLANSASLIVKISPSALAITGPSPANANTNICAGPFYAKTLDGSSNVAAAVSTITANLAFTPALVNGVAPGAFYSDSACTTPITNVVFAAGVSTNTFYFSSYYPAVLNLTATDAANPVVLTQGTFAWTVIAAPAWIGTGLGTGGGGTASPTTGSPYTWQSGKVPVNGRLDAPYGVFDLHFSANHKYLYVVDQAYQRILKYDYSANQYIGWIGLLNKWGGVAPTGSNIFALTSTIGASAANALNSNCITLGSGLPTPGWCQGGQYYTNGVSTAGGLYNPTAVTDDGTYIYVVNTSNYTITRYMADTGQFSGWIGRINSNAGLISGIDSTGTSLGTCSSSNPVNSITPGWCQNGASNTSYYAYVADGLTVNGQSITYATDPGNSIGYIYVGGNGMVNRYNALTGAFAGWIGWISATSGTTNVVKPLISAPGMTNSCGSASANTVTPGWCSGGIASVNGGSALTGGISTAVGVFVDTTNNFLYVASNSSQGTVAQYNLTTGAWIKTIVKNGVPFAFSGIAKITFDQTNFYVADSARIAKFDTSGTFYGWIGKVATTASLTNASSNPSGTCSATGVSSNTPGWCIGGTAKNGIDEGSFHQLYAIADDGAGNLLTGQGPNFPAIKKFDKATGNYGGMLVNTSNAPTRWTNVQDVAGLQGYDDNSMFSPSGMWNDGTNLYVTEVSSARVKQISLTTGATLGWVGGVGGFVTGITQTLGCGSNPIGVTSGWCLGALFSPTYLWSTLAPYLSNGMMNAPMGIAGDANYLYIADQGLHRILRYKISNGSYAGWIGGIGATATTGPATAGDSTSCTNAVNQFTPGWCLGGIWVAGSGNGYLNAPSAITISGTSLYVADYNNGRVSQYNAVTGAFLGWIGRVSSNAGLSPAQVTRGGFNYTSGWSTGGVPMPSSNSDPGGGLLFLGGRAAITTDGTYLYVANGYNSRIERFNLATGAYVNFAGVRSDVYTGVWNTTVPGWNGYGTTALAYSNGYIYSSSNYNAGAVIKMNAATGSVVGWRGGIATVPSGPTGSTCIGATGVTPDWCQGGSPATGVMLGNSNNIGGFGAPYGLTVDANYLYISDENIHRVTRYPK